MPRRVRLPGAAELFRGSAPAEEADTRVGTPESSGPNSDEASLTGSTTVAERRASGRVRHDEKITVYVSTDELVALEQARLALRSDHGLGVDRGRIVRAALAAAIDDLATSGADSELARRLRGQWPQ